MYISPIAIPSAPKPNPLEKLIDQILFSKQADSAADVSALESEIDDHVYRLYGLTKDEIKIIEENLVK